MIACFLLAYGVSNKVRICTPTGVSEHTGHPGPFRVEPRDEPHPFSSSSHACAMILAHVPGTARGQVAKLQPDSTCLRVAVCGQLEHALERQTDILSPAFDGLPVSKSTPTPEEFYGAMRSYFEHFYDSYIHRCRKNEHLDGSEFQDHFSGNKGTFEFGRLRQRLECIRERLLKQVGALPNDAGGQSSSPSQETWNERDTRLMNSWPHFVHCWLTTLHSNALTGHPTRLLCSKFLSLSFRAFINIEVYWRYSNGICYVTNLQIPFFFLSLTQSIPTTQDSFNTRATSFLHYSKSHLVFF